MPLSELIGVVALVMSLYSLWQTSLRRSALKVFVPPVIRYASPYQNSNFEAFAIPLTIVNEGARTGTVLSMQLEVSNPQTNLSKRFYSADFGPWSIEKSQTGGFRPFAPMVLAGRASQTEIVLFYSRNEEKVMQIVEAVGRYRFTLTLDAVPDQQFGFIDRLWREPPAPLQFEMELPFLDHRAFTSGSGTLALHHGSWQSTAGG